MRYILVWLIIMFVIGSGLCLHGRPSICDQNEIRLSLAECVEHALVENLNLKSYHLGLQFDNLSIVQAESKFDPSLSFEINRSESKTPNFIDYIQKPTIDSKTTSLNLSLGQNISTGANWGVGMYNTLSVSNIESEKNYKSNLAFVFNQPLLKGYGKKISRSNIFLTRLNSQSTLHEVENQATMLVYDVESAYWNLVYNSETLKVRELSIAQAESLLAYNLKGLELGVLTESDVLEARSELLARQQEAIDQKNLIRTSEDLLIRLLNITTDDDWERRLIPSDTPKIPEIDLDAVKALTRALELRPDYKIIQKNLKQNELYLAMSKNSMLPNLDLSARYRIDSKGKTFSKDIGELRDFDEYGWNLGIMFSYPLKNRSAKADYEKKLITIKRTQLSIDDFENRIMSEIRSSIRNVQSNREKIDVAKLSVEVNEIKLKKEEERFRNQLSTSYFVLQFQRDLADAKNIYNKALMDYTMAVIDLQRARGTLLKDLNIKLMVNDN